MSARDKAPLDSGMQSAVAIADTPVEHRRNYGVHRCDWFIAELGKPEPLRTVIAWDSASELPCAAYFDAEEQCWFSQQDGARIDDVTNWMYCLTPDGLESGSSRPTSNTAGAARATKIKRLAEQANTITAMLSTIHILEAADQESALRNCSSMADDFSHELNTLVGEPA
jgi:hypothetical protein